MMSENMTRRDFVGAGALTSVGAALSTSPAPGSDADRGGAGGERAGMIRLPANYYQQFDADPARDVPGEAYGGWKRAEVELSRRHTAVVVMHAWDCGSRQQFPGWYRAVEYIPRANAICEHVFPPLLQSVREQGLRLFHVVGGGDYYKRYPGYQRTRELAGAAPPPVEEIEPDESLKCLRRFRSEHVFVGRNNEYDVKCGTARLDFAPQAKPRADESIAEDAHQLFALCKHFGVNHLIYAGFAINWCLLMSPGGMLDLSRRGVMCSALRQAVTAVENKETARRELCKELALWRVALAFGFVFDVDDFLAAIRLDAARPESPRVRTSTTRYG
jgi:hypothetical protein